MNDMSRTSWVASANDPATDFPIQNLPYGVFRHTKEARIGVAIGDHILDLHACANAGLLAAVSAETVAACSGETLNALMSLGPGAWSTLRRHLTVMLDRDQIDRKAQRQIEAFLLPMNEVAMLLPAQIGDYTDFYASIHHATRVGKIFRPDNPLLPNYKYVPIGYHGRASSIVISGADIVRPCGQLKRGASEPIFGATEMLDYELEVGMFVGPGNSLGVPIPISEAEQHAFGLCLVNDWSARDIQSWESQPLGPFLSKSFATTISPWIVSMEALAPYRVPAFERAEGDPDPLPYLRSPNRDRDGIDLTLIAYLQTQRMRELDMAPVVISEANLRDLYWAIPQLFTHHSSNGCNLRPGDLLATGTISGPRKGSEGCLLEKRLDLVQLVLPTGEVRTFLDDNDQISLRAYTQSPGVPRIGFGECVGTIRKGALSTGGD
jgi:fumarylacetoacetase